MQGKPFWLPRSHARQRYLSFHEVTEHALLTAHIDKLVHAQVVDALRRIGKVEGAESLVRPAIPCEQPLHYRNKMTFSLTINQACGGLSTGYGFKKVGCSDVVSVSQVTT